MNHLKKRFLVTSTLDEVGITACPDCTHKWAVLMRGASCKIRCPKCFKIQTCVWMPNVPIPIEDEE